jgi:site-specific DNA-adenine methylase
VAHLIWERLGDPDNVIEPFCGSCAFLLARPHPPRIETVNDADHMIANFWRATQFAPEEVVEWCDWPVNEVDLHSVHRWLVLGEEAEAFRLRMRADPDYFDAKRAGRWLFGICAWIGSGWCDVGQLERNQNATPALQGSGGHGQGVHRTRGDADPASKVRIAGHNRGSCGKGVHAQGELHEKRPCLGQPQRKEHGGSGTLGRGVHAEAPILSQQRPQLDGNANGKVSNGGVPCTPVLSQKRPFIAGGDSHYDMGVHAGNPSDLGTCEQRREWLLAWFCRLRDRLRNVRVCCGDWERVCSSESVLTRLGSTAVYFDPPYGKGAKRKKGLYSQDSETVAADVRRWCLEHGDNRDLRIVLSGYAEEGHEELERHGWTVVHWTSSGGYGNSTEQGRKNRKKERLWCSPHCIVQRTLFDGLPAEEAEA